MKLTEALKKYAEQSLGVEAGSEDVAYTEAITKALVGGDLSAEKYAELSADQTKTKREEFVSGIMGEMSKSQDALVAKLVGALSPQQEEKQVDESADAMRIAAEEAVKKYQASLADTGDAATAKGMLQDEGKQDANIRVKKASERYSQTKTAVTWEKGLNRGQPARHLVDSVSKGYDEPSQAEYAKCGAIAKWKMIAAARKAGIDITLNEHEKQLVAEAVNEDTWVGPLSNGGYGGSRRFSDMEVKTVLDETGGSVGAEAVPEYFDDAIIATPLLHGELFPLVNVISVPRGSSADGFSIGTPTFVSTASGSAVSPFSTTSFVAAFDTTFYPATCAIEFGRDFISDATPQFGQAVIAQIGQEALRWLDEQIAVGDGTTEPQGIFTASGTAVSSVGGTTASMVYNDAVNLAFGIDKAHRNAFGGNRTVYVMSDNQYKLLMEIATGVTGDTRPIFGMNLKDYRLGDYDVKIQNNISGGSLALANLGGYRMYRRQGLQFETEEGGRTLILANKRLVCARMRWGGQSTLPSGYIAQMTDADVP